MKPVDGDVCEVGAPVGVREGCLLQDKALIVVDFVFVEERDEFLFEGGGSMMVFLIENVLSDVFSLRFADAEPAVATLPCEVWDVFFDPFTGVGFEFAHEVGVGDCGA